MFKHIDDSSFVVLPDNASSSHSWTFREVRPSGWAGRHGDDSRTTMTQRQASQRHKSVNWNEKA